MPQFTYFGDERVYPYDGLPTEARNPRPGETYELDAAPDDRWKPVEFVSTDQLVQPPATADNPAPSE